MKPEQSAHVHRFHDQVAFHTDSMPDTVYLSPYMAHRLGAALQKYALDCLTTHRFSESHLGTEVVQDRPTPDPSKEVSQ